MKRVSKKILLLGSLVCTFSLFGEESKEEKEPSPYSLSAIYDSYNSARVKHPHHDQHKHLSFREGSFMGTYNQSLSKTSGLLYGVGYRHTHMNWRHYHKFDQHSINNVLLSFGGYTETSDNWFLDTNLILQVNADHLSLSRYTYFNGWVHGKTHWKNDIFLHAGLIVWTGMHFTRVLPILGFDWRLNKDWYFEVIFPNWAKARYRIFDSLSVEATIRTFLSRQRLDDHNDHKRRLIAYRNLSGEIGLNYEWNSFACNLHAGQTFLTRMRTSNHNDKDRKHLQFKDSFYWGLEVKYLF